MNATLRIALTVGLLVLVVIVLGLAWNFYRDATSGSYRASPMVYGLSLAVSLLGIRSMWRQLNT